MKLRKKLLLSCAALAACATTMVSTTYAWYVVNPTATASGMTGATADAEGTASIYLSEDGALFQKSIEITAGDYLVDATLNPITTEDGISFVKNEIQTPADGETPATYKESKEYIQFAIWVKTSEDATVTPVLTTTNETTEYTTQTAYQTVGSTENLAAGKSFYVDAVQALRMSVTEVTADTKDAAKTAFEAASTSQILDVQSISKNYTPTSELTDDTLTMDAHTYYEKLMGETPFDTDDATPATSWATFDTTENVAKCFVFTIWLEGADTLCFDSCVGQDFSFSIEFTAANKATGA